MRRHLLDVAVLFVLSSGACAYVSLEAARRTKDRHPRLSPVPRRAADARRRLGSRRRRGRAHAGPTSTSALDERPEPAGPVPQLAKVEREVTLAIGNAYDFHSRLLPHLREIAGARLERRGQRPGPDTLGRWWELLRPDRPEPSERFAPGNRRAGPAGARRRPGADLVPDGAHRGQPRRERGRRRGREGGHREARCARAPAARPACRRARPARGLSRPREDADGAVVRAGVLDGLLAHPVHAGPDAVRRDGLVRLQPARRRLPVPAGADLRQPAARGRDQPRTAENAGRAARGDAGASGDDRGRDAPARSAVPRHGDAEPDRVRGDVSPPRGTARPVPAAHVGRLSGA